jgi:hypothetical protein
VTQAWGAIAAVEADHATTVLATKTFAHEVVAVRDDATLRIKDAEDRAALAEREALERVSRVEVENFAPLASICEDVEGFARKITLLEDELVRERRA